MDINTTRKIIAALEQAMLENVGVSSVTVDGETIQFSSRKDIVDQIDYFTKRVANYRRKRSIFKTIGIGQSF